LHVSAVQCERSPIHKHVENALNNNPDFHSINSQRRNQLTTLLRYRKI